MKIQKYTIYVYMLCYAQFAKIVPDYRLFCLNLKNRIAKPLILIDKI